MSSARPEQAPRPAPPAVRVAVTGTTAQRPAAHETEGPRRGRARVENRFVPLPAEPTREVRFELGKSWDGTWPIDPQVARGARIKPVVVVAEASVANVDKFGLKAAFERLGAVYVKTPVVHVVRHDIKRDDRHAVDLPLEQSLSMFAEETQVNGATCKITFAATLAREADAGVKS